MSDDVRTGHVMPLLTNSSWLWNWPKGRIVVAVSFLAATMVALVFQTWTMVGVSAVTAFAGILAITPAVNNRKYNYQMPSEWIANYREKSIAKKRGPYRSLELREVLYTDDERKNRRQKVDPVSPQLVPLQGGAGGYLTEVVTSATNRHTTWTIADGFGRYLASTPETAVFLSDAFSNVLSNASDLHGLSGLHGSLFFANVPEDATEAWEFHSTAKHKSEDDEHLAAMQDDYLNLMADAAGRSVDFVGGIGISVPRPRSWNKAPSPDQISPADIRNAVLYQITESLIEGLSGVGVNNPRRPTPYEATRLLRAGFDVMAIDEFYENWYADRQRIREDKLTDFSDSLTMSSGMMPVDWDPGHNYLRIGSTYHRIFYVPNYQDRYVEGGVFQVLYGASTSILYSIAEVYTTVDAASQKRRINLTRTTQDARRKYREDSGASQREAEAAQHRELNEADAVFYHSRGPSVKKTCLPAVCASSLEELDEAGAQLQKIFRQVNLPLNPVKGRSLQVPVQLARMGIVSTKI